MQMPRAVWGKARRSFHRRCPHPKGGVRSGRADKLYAQRHPARRQLSGDHEGRDSGDAEQIDQRPARCEGLLRGVYGRGGGEGHRQQQEIHLERGEEGVDLPRKSLLVEQAAW